jgi:TolA-binding protein
MKLFISILCLCILAFAREPSVFKAGDLEVISPYGLTDTEKYILDNKRELKRFSSKIKKLKSKLKISMELLVDSDFKLQNKISNLKTDLKQKQNILLKDIFDIKNNLSNNVEVIKLLKISLIEMSDVLDVINAQYVKKNTFEARISAIEQKLKNINVTGSRKVVKKQFNKISGYDMIKKSEKLLKEKKYRQARVILTKLIAINYRKARSSFYLGEVSFYQKRYVEALSLYKQSINIYQKSDYREKLFLHSAIASLRLKRKQEAYKFLTLLVSEFKGTQEAKKAKEILLKYYKGYK